MPGVISPGQQLGLGLWPAWAAWTGLGSEPPGYGLFGVEEAHCTPWRLPQRLGLAQVTEGAAGARFPAAVGSQADAGAAVFRLPPSADDAVHQQ